jgi:thiol-disulfide isomerase/thioredoxin
MMDIVFIGASWCSSCLVMRSRLEKVLKETKDIVVTEMDIDSDAEKIMTYNPGKILPVMVFVIDAVEKKRIIGEIALKTLSGIVASLQS